MPGRPGRRSTLWIDLDNAPHVVFFAPVVRALEARGVPVALTARAVNDTPALAAHYGLAPEVSGHGFGRNRLHKLAGTMIQALRLARRMRGRSPALAISHGSRAQALAAALLRVPIALFFDYENADLRAFKPLDTHYFYPEALAAQLGPMAFIPPGRRHAYPGLKEHLALLSASGDLAALATAGVPVQRPYAVVRPESDTAHYLDGQGHDDVLLAALRKCREWDLVPVVVPRAPEQRARLQTLLAGSTDVVFPSRAVTGTDLLAGARLLVSGGGTMNREAVVLGLPCISMFRGRLGALDRSFIEGGRMLHAPTAAAIEGLAAPPSPPAAAAPADTAQQLLSWIVQHLVELVPALSADRARIGALSKGGVR